ncbi:MAG: zinc-ribbon domain-containing protein [Coriobacteriales bacterium]|nr:zinc-ribbon domain-containing protein [Coriobacteriales bacterium]
MGCGRCQGIYVSKIIPRGLCDRCGTQNQPSAQFCRKCGAPIDNTKVNHTRPGTR